MYRLHLVVDFEPTDQSDAPEPEDQAQAMLSELEETAAKLDLSLQESEIEEIE